MDSSNTKYVLGWLGCYYQLLDFIVKVKPANQKAIIRQSNTVPVSGLPVSAEPVKNLEVVTPDLK